MQTNIKRNNNRDKVFAGFQKMTSWERLNFSSHLSRYNGHSTDKCYHRWKSRLECWLDYSLLTKIYSSPSGKHFYLGKDSFHWKNEQTFNFLNSLSTFSLFWKGLLSSAYSHSIFPFLFRVNDKSFDGTFIHLDCTGRLPFFLLFPSLGFHGKSDTGGSGCLEWNWCILTREEGIERREGFFPLPWHHWSFPRIESLVCPPSVLPTGMEGIR